MVVLGYVKVIEQDDLQYATKGSAAFDLRGFFPPATKGLAIDVDTPSELAILQGESIVLRTGIKFQIPRDHVLKVYVRSGLAFKHGISLMNGTGIIDSDYTDEVLLKLVCHGEGYVFKEGDRVAQAILERLDPIYLKELDSLTETNRGGFGSTGVGKFLG